MITSPGDLTVDWLTAAIGAGPVTAFETLRIGTGQMSECYRVTVTYASGDGPDSVVLKVAARDPVSRQTGLALGLYEREVRFYTDVAPRLGGPIAHCHHAAVDTRTGAFDILLGDAGNAVQGDEIVGATVEQARLGLVELARLHAPVLRDPTLAHAEWLNRPSPMNQALITQLWAGFVDRYSDRITVAQRDVCGRLVAGFDAYLAAGADGAGPQGLVHGDYRLDNMLFGREGAARPLTVVDWQTVTRGPAMTDTAYFLGCALDSAVRAAHHDELLAAYHEALGPEVTLSIDEVRDGVRRQSFFGVMMAIVSSMLVERTERGDEMFMTMLERHCRHVLDTGALDLLSAPTPVEPLVPSVDDEYAHPPGDEPLWSESWYADFVDAGSGIGGWFRLGLQPNQGASWVSVFLCGPDIPTIAVVDFEAPLPTDPSLVHTETYDLQHAAPPAERLQTYRLGFKGRGHAYDDPSALLRGEAGRACELTMDLTWSTAGAPYRYRITTRYEIPCIVSGLVTADGQVYPIEGAAGQRDHSWGVRDWWSMEWMWSALHLLDETRIHALDLRLPGAPSIGIGYLQTPGTSVTEVNAVSVQESFADNGLPESATISITPGDVTAALEIRGHAPMRLTGPDGAVSMFPRAWASVTTEDGRIGVGWVEWNRNQRIDLL